MRAVLQAIAEELVRLKAEGESAVPVSEATMVSLRALVQSHLDNARGGPALGIAGSELPPRDAAAVRAPGVPVSGKGFSPQKSLPTAGAAMPVRLPGPDLGVLNLPPPPILNLPAGDKPTRWAAWRAAVQANPVCVERVGQGRRLVLGEGSLDARVLLVGDAPSAEDEAAGQPFMGEAGELLTKMLSGMGLKRENVFILPLVPWRPVPTGTAGTELTRPLSVAEMVYCAPFLQAAIDVVKPELVVALGGTAAQGVLGKSFTTLAAARGRWLEHAGYPLRVSYHPNYLINSGTKKSKRAVWEDLLEVMVRLNLPISEKQRGYYL